MSGIAALVADNLDIWTSAIERKSSSGRGSSKGVSLYGIDRLRSLILDLAVRGKLVPQDPLDDPASKLMDAIAVERARLIADKKISKPKKLEPISGEELSVPGSWVVTRFGNIFSLEYGDNLPERKRSGTGEFDVYGSNGVVGSHDQCSVSAPCLVIGRKGSAGAINIALDPCWVTDVAYSCAPPEGVDLHFQYILFQTLGLDGLGKGIKPGLNRNEANTLAVPLPPLAEQKRIVAKVDELMALCDALEQESEDALAAHQTLVETLLATLVNSTDVADLAMNWSRLEEHFDTLFTTEASIDALKQTILDLAVRGKLVKQDEDEGSASAYFALEPSNNERALDGYPDLPSGWACCALDQIIGGMDSGWSPACHPFPAQTEDNWGVLKTTAVQELEYWQEENKELPEKFEPRESAEARAGDILITRAGPTNRVGICCFVPETRTRLMISDKIIRFRPSSKEMSGQFLALALSAGPAAQHLEGAKSGMASSQVNISQTKLKNTWLMLPPPAEQRRIIAKVDELMVVCNALKSRFSDAAETQRHLADAIVERAAA